MVTIASQDFAQIYTENSPQIELRCLLLFQKYLQQKTSPKERAGNSHPQTQYKGCFEVLHHQMWRLNLRIFVHSGHPLTTQDEKVSILPP